MMNAGWDIVKRAGQEEAKSPLVTSWEETVLRGMSHGCGTRGVDRPSSPATSTISGRIALWSVVLSFATSPP